MSAIRTIVFLAAAGGCAAWYQHHKATSEMAELEAHRQTLAGRLADSRKKLAAITQDIEALEKRWDYSQSLKTAGEEIFAMQEEADRLRTEWRTKRNEFEQKVADAQKAVQGRSVASIRLKSGQELKNCILGTVSDTRDTISITHDDGITRVPGADLTGPVADYLRLGWKLELPPELDAPEVLTDLQVEVKDADMNAEPTEARLPPPPPIDALSVQQLKERRAKAISRAHVLNDQIAAAKKEARRKEEAIARTEGQYEAARMFGQSKQLSLKTQIAEANKKLFDFRMRIRRAEWEKLALKRDVTIIDNKLKAIEAKEAKEAAKPASPAPAPLR